MMRLDEAIEILGKEGYVVESAVKGQYKDGEGGGEAFMDLGNDYDYDDARRYFASAIIGPSKASDREYLDMWWDEYMRKPRKIQFEKTWEQFEKYRAGEPVKLHRGLVVKSGTKIDLEKVGECWSFSRPMTQRWVDGIWDEMVYNHVVNRTELEDCQKYIMAGTTTLDNCRLPYSFWLAGRFERREWEVRLKDEDRINVTSVKEVE